MIMIKIGNNIEHMETKSTLPETFGNTPLKRIVAVYSKIWKSFYGFIPQISYPMMGKLFKPLYTEFSEWQVAALICVHFNWHGATGEDNFAFKVLAEKCFPLEWLPKNVNGYRAYIINTLRIDWDNEAQIKQYVIDSVKNYTK